MKQFLTLLIALALVMGIASCGKTATTSSAPSSETAVSYAGVLDGEKTNASLQHHGDVYQLFGSSLREFGSSLTMNADHTASYTIGVIFAEGTWEKQGDGFVLHVTDKTETPVERTVPLTVQEENGIPYFLMDSSFGEADDDAETLYWKITVQP